MDLMQRVNHSFVHFRPNPADESRVLLLGMVIGFQTERFWAVGMAMRGSLPVGLVETLDSLSQAMLENRAEIIKNQIQAQFETCSRPEDVITAIVNDNFTSFYMTPMKSELVDLSVRPSDASMEKLAEEFVLTLFHKQRAEAAKIRSAAAQGAAEESMGDQIASPPPWMAGTQVWFRPTL